MSFRFKHGDRPLDGYTIQRGVGRGGFGEVYYAISDGGREVALKALLLNHEIELRGVSQCINLKNPHLVSIFDVRTTPDSMPFVIMEYVAGPSLRDILRERPQGLGRETAGYFLREIGKGLAYLHDRGIVHRDLKPENIFFEDGYVKIGDYGLSKYISVSRQSGQTMSVGTVHYMAPEIGTGIYNRGIDIYALGIILYELLTGKVPFSGDSFGEIIMKHLTAKPDLSDADEPFRTVIARALEKKPEDRYPTVEVMIEELFRAEALQSSVSTFNPSSLSAPRATQMPGARVPHLPGAAATAETLVIGNGHAHEREPHLAFEPAAGGAAVGLATPPPGGADSDRRDDPFREALPPPPPQRPAYGVPARIDEEVDPLDESQRRARAVFALALATLGTMILPFLRFRFPQAMGFLLLTASSSGAILLSEGAVARKFKVDPGPWRRLLAAVIAAPVAVIFGTAFGVFEPRHWESAAMIHLLSLVIINWGSRVDPKREARVAVSSALAACVPAFILNLFFLNDFRGVVVQAALLATISFVLNALSPFIPPYLRKKKKRGAPAAPGPVATAVETANRWPLPPRAPAPPTRERKRWSWKSRAGGWRPGKQGRGAAIPAHVPDAIGSDALPRPAHERATPRLPWHRRPPHAILRFLGYCLGMWGLVMGIIALGGSLAKGEFRLYILGVVSSTAGVFFLRQARRVERGTLWGGTVRPLLLHASVAALMICAAMYTEWSRLPAEGQHALWRGASFAIATWILAYTLRSPHDKRTSPLADPAAPVSMPGAPASPARYVHRGWAAFGTLLWIAAIGMTMIASGVSTRAIEILDPSNPLLATFGRSDDNEWALAGNLVVAAAVCMLVSRKRAGAAHLVRGILGQAAFGILILSVYQLSQEVLITQDWALDFRYGRRDILECVFTIMACGIAGFIFVVWPMSRKKLEPLPQGAGASPPPLEVTQTGTKQ